MKSSLCEKCPNTEFFLARIFLYSVRIQENTDQKKTPYLGTFTQCFVDNFLFVFLNFAAKGKK